MNSLKIEARTLMHRKLNNRLRFLKKRYGNRHTQTIYNWEDKCSYIHYWYSGEWTPDYQYHGVISERVNDYVDNVLDEGIWIENTQYFFKNPLDYRSIDFLNWNYKFRKHEIIYSTKIDHNILCDDYDEFLTLDDAEYAAISRTYVPDYFTEANIQHDSNVDGFEDGFEDEDDDYNVKCYGKVWGCPETTNGTQFCCKHYCPYEFCDEPYTFNVLNGENDPWSITSWE